MLQQNIRLETILRQLIEALQQHEQETAKKQQRPVRPEKTDQGMQQKKNAAARNCRGTNGAAHAKAAGAKSSPLGGDQQRLPTGQSV